MYTSTYSCDDNKLRFYASGRLDPELYARVRAAGFIWAPKQELFVAPAWSPIREDLMIELCGEIGDEDTSLVDRAEQRAERFEDYSEKRGNEAERAKAAVSAIADNIPFGQPILCGHHSEKHARKDAEKIRSGMEKTIRLWETSEYWTRRASGALAHAKYKELPAVRARRIKTIEADKRRTERTLAEAVKKYNAWKAIATMEGAEVLLPEDQDVSQMNNAQKLAYMIANYHSNWTAQHPRSEEANAEANRIWHHGFSAYDFLTKKEFIKCPFETLTPKQVAELYLQTTKDPAREGSSSHRWISHFENRLAYEKAMLDEQGASELIAKKQRPTQLPLCNYRASEGFIMVENNYHRGEMMKYAQIDMTKAEYAKIYGDYKGTRDIERSHRVRTCIKPGTHEHVTVFLTDSKVHPKPEPVEPTPKAPKLPRLAIQDTPEAQGSLNTLKIDVEAMRDTLRAGITTVSAPQLFPTPPELAARMVEMAEIPIDGPTLTVLEPSAGTGNLITAMNHYGGTITAVEINTSLSEALRIKFPAVQVWQADFLELTPGFFDRVIQNPPFENGSDIKHILHALGMLNPEGKLVALCANGPRQEKAFKHLASHWEVLPEGSFKNQGTMVSVVLLVIDNKKTD